MAGAKTANLSLDPMLDEFAGVWQTYKIGTLTTDSRNPMVILISNCTVCGHSERTERCSNVPSMRVLPGDPERTPGKAREGEPEDQLCRGRPHLVQAPWSENALAR